MRYEAIPQPGGYDIEEVLSRGDLAELRLIPLSVSLHSENPEQAERRLPTAGWPWGRHHPR